MFARAIKYLNAKRARRRLYGSPFYERYPFLGEAALKTVDRRGMCAPEYRFFFNRIPKSANSTVATFLAERCGIVPVAKDPEGSWAKEAFKRPSQLSRQEVDALANCLRFTFVRNPYSRVLSAYLDKVTTGEKAQNLSSFTEFCRFLDSGGLHLNAHWAPQSSLFLMPFHEFNFVGKMESLQSDMIELANLLGFPPPNENHRAGPRPTNASKLFDDHYTEEARKIVTRLYRSDFELLGYSVL